MAFPKYDTRKYWIMTIAFHAALGTGLFIAFLFIFHAMDLVGVIAIPIWAAGMVFLNYTIYRRKLQRAAH